ncbi:hypothetical protein F8568_044325 [Actinomadura sp. LD22]|uniref:YokE-like PH domain-containing protein n=1 Tax=Actinomadura physcomitrii TaxID=2650748 RepID=A0A6I4MTF4_9ACTN|nr:hypothetical protein [Actinomadura physcomitrii]MWA07244.1 hypothetical protein [Actinomadura physcomitrii]
MSARTKLAERLAPQMAPGEAVDTVVVAQLKRGMKQQLGKSLATGLATGLATAAATGGVGLVVVAVPPAVWVVVTSHRVLMFKRINGSSRPGALVFDAPREALAAERKSGLLNQVVIADRSDGQSLVRLNLGVRKKAANEIVASIER